MDQVGGFIIDSLIHRSYAKSNLKLAKCCQNCKHFVKNERQCLFYHFRPDDYHTCDEYTSVPSTTILTVKEAEKMYMEEVSKLSDKTVPETEEDVLNIISNLGITYDIIYSREYKAASVQGWIRTYKTNLPFIIEVFIDHTYGVAKCDFFDKDDFVKKVNHCKRCTYYNNENCDLFKTLVDDKTHCKLYMKKVDEA